MNYLSPLQFRVLKYSAVPGLLMLYYFFVLREKYHPSDDMATFLKAGFMSFIVGWEFLVRKDFKRAGIFVISAALMYFLVMLAFNWMEINIRANFFHFSYQLYTFISFCGLLFIRGLLLKDKFFIKTGLLTILIWYYGTSDMRGLSFIIEAVLRVVTDGHSSPVYSYAGNFIHGVYQFLLPCFYYIILYFTENYLNDTDSFRQKFHSKILVMSAGEYVFFYSILFMLLIGSSMGLGQMVETWANIRMEDGMKVFIIIFYNLCLVLTIVLSGYLIRNIMVARSLTIDLHNGLLYYLHCLPFLNLIPVLIYGTRKDIHTTITENAESYMKRGDSKIANWIIVIGIIMSLYGLYQGYEMLQHLHYYSASSVFKVFVIAVTGIQFIRLIIFLRLRSSRKAVYVLFSINLLSVCILLFGTIEVVAIRLGICYMSLYLLLEIFHPTLFGEDAEALPITLSSEE